MDRRTTSFRALMPVLVVALVVALVAGACGSDGGQAAPAPPGADTDATSSSSTAVPDADQGCDEPVTEPLDPASVQHVLPGGPEPTYLTDPPTSGVHQVGPTVSGALDAPVSRPVQVGILEGGHVIVQYLDPSTAPEAEQFASETVVVAPNPDLPAPVVATAWRTKMTCDQVDVAAISAFIDDHAGRGPGSDS